MPQVHAYTDGARGRPLGPAPARCWMRRGLIDCGRAGAWRHDRTERGAGRWGGGDRFSCGPPAEYLAASFRQGTPQRAHPEGRPPRGALRRWVDPPRIPASSTRPSTAPLRGLPRRVPTSSCPFQVAWVPM
eukprot:scaffold1035_cov374-Prasinococcus_capsulatus_cf.AAC.7